VYGHVNRYFVEAGERVSAGQQIAEVGNRGQSTGPHLHIEVTTPAGTKVNPKPWLDEQGIGYT
jgi:murein DD-endopeptidase MepM/ murein hydrolase activator NlpD